MNIIILLGGKGQRFKDEHYMRPKPLVNVAGRPLITCLLDCLRLLPDDHLYLVYQKSLDQHGFSSVVATSPHRIHLHPIEVDTRGPVETALCLLNQWPETSLDRPALTLDGDTVYDMDVLAAFRAQPTNLIFYSETTEPLPLFSYIERNNQGQVLRIREKERISSLACTGAYGFESGRTLLQFASAVMQTSVLKEFYMSTVYQALLDAAVPVQSHLVSRFHCLGTPQQVGAFVRALNHSPVPLRICFDLDETLVSRPVVKGDYTTVQPLADHIAICREMKRLGHTIILYTARRMQTHGGNVGRVLADIGLITLQTLQDLDIPYDEIYFGKPFADLYVDDKAINSWYHLHQEIGIYLDPEAAAVTQALPAVLPPRAFHKIEVQGDVLVKTSRHIAGEIYWYEHCPPALAVYIPRCLNTTAETLRLEYVPGPTWSHLYVNGALTVGALDQLLAALRLLHTPPSGESFPVNIYANYADKLDRRYREYPACYQRWPRAQRFYHDLRAELQDYEWEPAGAEAVIHGDPVFTNVIAARTGGFKWIDMRGALGNQLTLRGDVRYDYAKVYQSLCGYDAILHGRTPCASYVEKLRRHFEAAVAMHHLHLLTASLFFTLLPLHENVAHQDAFFALAEQLFAQHPRST